MTNGEKLDRLIQDIKEALEQESTASGLDNAIKYLGKFRVLLREVVSTIK